MSHPRYLQVNGVHCPAGPHSLRHEQGVMAVATCRIYCHITRLQHLQQAAEVCMVMMAMCRNMSSS
jgi:hypothetical protein